jgi:hypothetical protein
MLEFLFGIVDFFEMLWGISAIWKFIFNESYRNKTFEELHSEKFSDKVIEILKLFFSAVFNLLIIGLLVYAFFF